LSLTPSIMLFNAQLKVPFVHMVRFALDEGVAPTSARRLTVGVGVGGVLRIGISSASDR